MPLEQGAFVPVAFSSLIGSMMAFRFRMTVWLVFCPRRP